LGEAELERGGGPILVRFADLFRREACRRLGLFRCEAGLGLIGLALVRLVLVGLVLIWFVFVRVRLAGLGLNWG
jgi:hypothetical protein